MSKAGTLSWATVPRGTAVYVPSEDCTGRIFNYTFIEVAERGTYLVGSEQIVVAYGKHPRQRRLFPASKCYTDKAAAHEYEAHYLRGKAKQLETWADRHTDAARAGGEE